MITAATPACSNSRAKNGALRSPSSQPRRILTVTGTFTDSTMPRIRFTVLVVLHIIAEPPPPLTTLWTGQPMLTSMDVTP